MNKPKYVIFDCDGVLVDSEFLANTVEAEVKTELGFPTSAEEQIKKFVGMGTNHPLLRAEIASLPSHYLRLVDERLMPRFERDLRAIPGVAEVLESLALPKCVASSSELTWIERKLEITGLRGFLPDLFSGHMVANGKPAPDLFLFAAAQMGWDPAECLVVEDSVAGVKAAHAAGMRVCGFLGGSHVFPGHAETLISAGADILISDIRNLMAVAT